MICIVHTLHRNRRAHLTTSTTIHKVMYVSMYIRTYIHVYTLCTYMFHVMVCILTRNNEVHYTAHSMTHKESNLLCVVRGFHGSVKQ